LAAPIAFQVGVNVTARRLCNAQNQLQLIYNLSNPRVIGAANRKGHGDDEVASGAAG
jgi:hypothetical protein